MYYVSAQGVDERAINVHYYYYCMKANVIRSRGVGLGVVMVGGTSCDTISLLAISSVCVSCLKGRLHDA